MAAVARRHAAKSTVTRNRMTICFRISVLRVVVHHRPVRVAVTAPIERISRRSWVHRPTIGVLEPPLAASLVRRRVLRPPARSGTTPGTSSRSRMVGRF